MTFFSDMAEMVSDLLKPDTDGGLGAASGSIVLVREVPPYSHPEEPWEPVTPTVTSQTLKANSFGVPQKLVNGTTILAGDLYVISEVPSIDWKVPNGEAGQGIVVRIEIDGVPWQIVSTQDIPAAGIRSAVKFLIRK